MRQTALGYWQQDPLPTAEELERFYAEKYFQETRGQYQADYDAEERAWLRLDSRVAARIFAEHHQASAHTLLDVGCGEGFFLAGMEEEGFDVRGCDFSDFGIRRFHPALLDRFEHGNLFALLDRHLEEGRRYSLVNLGNVLEHVLDPEALLRRLLRVVAPQGLLRINVPNDFSSLQEVLTGSGRVDRQYWIAPMEHLNYFNGPSLRATLAACGWRPERSLSDFPIEHFLFHPASNYARDRTAGKAAHRARVTLDLHYARDLASYVRLFEAQAACGMGRSLVVFASPSLRG